MLRYFVRDRSGATVVEYGLIVAVLSLAIVGGVATVTNSVEFLFSNSNSRLQKAINGED